MRRSRLILILLLVLLSFSTVQALDPCIEKYGVVKGLVMWQSIIGEYQKSIREILPEITGEQLQEMTLLEFEGQFSILTDHLIQEMEEDQARQAVEALQTPVLQPVP